MIEEKKKEIISIINSLIEKVNKKQFNNSTSDDKISFEKYKTQKNLELDSYKKELNTILLEMDKIIKDITL